MKHKHNLIALGVLLGFGLSSWAGCDGNEFGGLTPGVDLGQHNTDEDGGEVDETGTKIPSKKDSGTCGGQSIPIQLVQKGDIPDLYLVVDRSGSMITPVDLFNFLLGSKWDVMRKTLASLVDTYKSNIRFGLSLFPSDDSCGAGKIDVPLQTGNTPTIKSKLTATSPNGNTPMHTTLAAVRTYLKSVAAVKGGRFVLLATDGEPNCGATEDEDTSPQTLTQVKNLYSDGVKTFVLGFGSIVAGNPTTLNQLANAGGAPNTSGSNKFYAATNEKELQSALYSIAGGIIPPPCTYKLTSKPADYDKVTVTFDGKAVPRTASNKNGWNYSSNKTEITFYGSYCTSLRLGQVKSIKFLFGCKGPVIE